MAQKSGEASSQGLQDLPAGFRTAPFPPNCKRLHSPLKAPQVRRKLGGIRGRADFDHRLFPATFDFHLDGRPRRADDDRFAATDE